MAGKIFDETLDVNNRIDRNNFDLSEAKHLTTNVGRVTPCYINLVPPNSSLQINPTFALKFMPFAYDLQNKLNARISFFKVPLRTLWSEYKDFVGNYDKSLVPPYIDFGSEEKIKRMLSVSSLCDYLGVPPFESGSYIGIGDVLINTGFVPSQSVSQSNFFYAYYTISSAGNFVLTNFEPKGNERFNLDIWADSKKVLMLRYNQPVVFKKERTNSSSNVRLTTSLNVSQLFKNMTSDSRKNIQLRFRIVSNKSLNSITGPNLNPLSDTQSLVFWSLKDGDNVKLFGNFNFSDGLFDSLGDDNYVLNDLYSLCIFVSSSSPHLNIETNLNIPLIWARISANQLPSSNPDSLPFYTSSAVRNSVKQSKISAYPFRAYESVYNCYYRDMRNNPYYVDGKVQYNKWIPTDKGGADTYEYKLYSANWERDFLTTAQHTPQQGDPNRPPLVGITTYTQSVRNEDGTLTTRENAAIVDETGRKFGLEFDSDEEGLTGVRYTRLADNLSVRSTRSLVDVAESGISIADLRNVNAYQKFLEMNMRKGYSYKDIIEGRFDVKVRYSDLQMPEFIGGVSRDFSTMAVTQMVDNTQDGNGSYKDVLGSQAGLSQVSGATDGISVFCDEECVIIGLLVITPRPVYTQLVPKWFYNRSLLDSFQPEFNHLGYQPIYNREINPYAAFRGGSMDDVFGYQRPWYDYVSKVDTACGLYRTQLTDFLMQRKYNGVPNLSVDFLTVKEEDVNNVFTVTDVSDKIFGQIYFDVRAKLPIARIAIPKLD